jgi:peptide/nickel transport system ATP-binding protein
MPTIERRLSALVPIEGSPPSLISPPTGCPFHPRCPHRFEPCDKEVPPLVAPPGGHPDACHLPYERKLEEGRRRAQVRLGGAA